MAKFNLLYVLIISLAFGDIPLPVILNFGGGIFHQAGFFFALFLIVLTFFQANLKIRFLMPNWPFAVITVFLFWVIVATATNIGSLQSETIQGQNRLFRFLSQFFVMIFGLTVSFAITQISSTDFCLKKIINAFVLSFVITGVVGALQIGLFVGEISSISEILKPIYSLFRLGDVPNGVGRVSALMPEPSLLALLISTTVPFLLVTETQKMPLTRLVLLILASALIVGANSRTGWIAAGIQVISFLFLRNYLFPTNKIKGRLIIFFLVIFLAGVSLQLYAQIEMFSYAINSLIDPFNPENPFISSNMTRFGTVLQSIKVGMSHPFTGVGLGGFPFEKQNFVDPQNADINDNKLTTTSLYGRIFAELGIIGSAIWLSLWVCLFFALFKKARKLARRQRQNDAYTLAILLSLIGVAASWLSHDSFGYINQYVILGLAIGRLRQLTLKGKIINASTASIA